MFMKNTISKPHTGQNSVFPTFVRCFGTAPSFRQPLKVRHLIYFAISEETFKKKNVQTIGGIAERII